MAYLLEHLGPERFQHFCQALLVRDYPDLQCFPVGQPDGGRDALSRGAADGAPAVVGQIKFKRSDEEENAGWMIKALEGELPKINLLIESGAKRYIMMTNARGTAHVDGGRIDRVQSWLNDNVAIEAVCLWRDDLERRLDGADASLKLSFPGVLTGEDALTLILEAQMGPHKERVSRALRAFVATQYQKDEEVKFRQVELANSLLGLFVDVPLDVGPIAFGTPKRRVNAEAMRAVRVLADESPELYFEMGFDSMAAVPGLTAGAADVLLDREVQAGVPWVVLEGAPGQGKSTLAQYVCQVHRARYLDKQSFLEQLPENHSGAAFRLPVKVDLRDLAGYFGGKPFLGRNAVGPDEHKSLESFLAELVSIQSGGLQYNIDDLAETASGVPMLLFLDGLDEVADLTLRKTLVSKVIEGLNRLKENSANVQVVVTSRPSLFGRASGFSQNFVRLSLAPISLHTINEYAAKWVVARNLDGQRAKEVREILGEKLNLSHIRELTRNPMQLTILLSLIHSIGYSLPDVRTDLYRQYVELFMTREAEKSEVVREHRQLLMEVVEYLAFTLQCSAESDRAAGSVNRDELRTIIAEHLQRSDQDNDILDDLFTGGLERVYVLVQRVEGLYEFEVQPLREYFAAKFLYSSAPVSNFRHQEVFGDRAQRFEAIAANPYWANVVRFYAGFYEGGEIGALSASLRELVASKDLALGVSARSVGAALLTDWVFRSKKYIQKEVIELVFDAVGTRLASVSLLPGFEKTSLPEQCGRDVLAKRLFNEYIVAESEQRVRPVCLLLRQNGGENLNNEFAQWVRAAEGGERSRRLEAAVTSGGLSRSQSDVLEELLFADGPGPMQMRQRMQGLIAFDPQLVDISEWVGKEALKHLLDWGGFTKSLRGHDLTRFAWHLTPELQKRPYGFGIGQKHVTGSTIRLKDGQATLGEVLEKFQATRVGSEQVHRIRAADVIDTLCAEYGDTWAAFRLSVLKAGYSRLRNEPGDGAVPLDRMTSPLTRAQIGRAWRGRIGWWSSRLQTEDSLERLFWLAVMIAWAPSKYLEGNKETVNDLLDNLSEEDFARLMDVLAEARQIRSFRSIRARSIIRFDENCGSRFMLATVVSYGAAQAKQIDTRKVTDEVLVGYLKQERITERTKHFPGWKGLTNRQVSAWLATFSEAHIEGADIADEALAHLFRPTANLSKAWSEKVLRSPQDYPTVILNAAYASINAFYSPRAVRDIAVAEKWTFE